MEDPCFDPDLNPLLWTCTAKDLQPLVEYVSTPHTNTFGKATKNFVYPTAKHRLVDDIVYEIGRFGGNSMVNVFRGRGVPYAEIVRDVASHLKVTAEKEASVEALEGAILLKILDESIKKMSPDERATLEDDFRRAGAKNVDLASGAPIAAVLAQAGVQVSGFLAYRTAAIVANAVAKLVLGRGLSLGANAALMKLIGFAAGPVGWAVSGGWTAIEVAGPAYRVTVPCVRHIALLRQQRKFGDMADS